MTEPSLLQAFISYKRTGGGAVKKAPYPPVCLAFQPSSRMNQRLRPLKLCLLMILCLNLRNWGGRWRLHRLLRLLSLKEDDLLLFVLWQWLPSCWRGSRDSQISFWKLLRVTSGVENDFDVVAFGICVNDAFGFCVKDAWLRDACVVVAMASFTFCYFEMRKSIFSNKLAIWFPNGFLLFFFSLSWSWWWRTFWRDLPSFQPQLASGLLKRWIFLNLPV